MCIMFPLHVGKTGRSQKGGEQTEYGASENRAGVGQNGRNPPEPEAAD